MSLVYSPLHGTGRISAQMVCCKLGFENSRLVLKQSVLDPELLSTPFCNPELLQVFDCCIELGKKIGADVLMLSDPELDRLGTLVKVGDVYVLLTGNVMLSGLCYYIFEARKQAGTCCKNGLVV